MVALRVKDGSARCQRRHEDGGQAENQDPAVACKTRSLALSCHRLACRRAVASSPSTLKRTGFGRAVEPDVKVIASGVRETLTPRRSGTDLRRR